MNGEEQKLDAGADRGVSPAIAVLLMAAVTIIIAAVIGAFVLGVGGQTEEPAPTVSADIEREVIERSSTEDDTRMLISHKGGDTLDISDIRIITETQCFDDDLLTVSEKRVELVDLPTSSIDSNNLIGDPIIQPAVPETDGPIDSDNDPEWSAGETNVFVIDGAECGVPNAAVMSVDVIHKPSNSIIVEESFGKAGFTPAALQTSVSNPTVGETPTHTLVLDGITYGTAGNSGDEVDTITVDYDPDNNRPSANDFDGLDETDVFVTMTRTLSSGLDRKSIRINDDTYSGTSATIDLNGNDQTDVAGPIKIEIDGIENPSSAGTYDVDITLEGDAGAKTFTETINIED